MIEGMEYISVSPYWANAKVEAFCECSRKKNSTTGNKQYY